MLKSYLDGGVPLVISSTTPHAIQSAEFVAESFSVKLRKSKLLYDANQDHERLEKVFSMIRNLSHKHDANVIILVTHHLCVTEFPVFVANKVFGSKLKRNFEVKPNEAVIVNLDEHHPSFLMMRPKKLDLHEYLKHHNYVVNLPFRRPNASS
ncbi:MAG: hypothetical protein WCW87_03090 [Candidatus Paceibacterota bacterium]